MQCSANSYRSEHVEQTTKTLGDIAIKGAWIHHNLRLKDKESRDHVFAVSKSNKDKMVTLQALEVVG